MEQNYVTVTLCIKFIVQAQTPLFPHVFLSLLLTLNKRQHKLPFCLAGLIMRIIHLNHSSIIICSGDAGSRYHYSTYCTATSIVNCFSHSAVNYSNTSDRGITVRLLDNRDKTPEHSPASCKPPTKKTEATKTPTPVVWSRCRPARSMVDNTAAGRRSAPDRPAVRRGGSVRRRYQPAGDDSNSSPSNSAAGSLFVHSPVRRCSSSAAVAAACSRLRRGRQIVRARSALSPSPPSPPCTGHTAFCCTGIDFRSVLQHALRDRYY